MTFLLRLLALALLASASACAAPRPSAAPVADMSDRESVISDGRDIAEAQCAACHAVGRYGDSPNPQAPHFRTLLSRYHAEVLEQELIEGIRVAHPMPEFQMNPQGVDALIVYLQSIQDTDARPANPHQHDLP